MSKTNTAGGAPASVSVTLDDLRTGRRARITTRECAQLTGVNKFNLDRHRVQGKGIPFSKDENGRVWYAAADVLASIDMPKHSSTSEYDTTNNIERIKKARQTRHAKLAAN